MAAISLPTAIRPTLSTTASKVLYGATISAGQALYLDPADAKYKPCDANSTLIIGSIAGIAMTPGVDSGYGYMATSGSIILVGSTLAVGTTYAVGQTAGSIVPDSDLTTGDYVSIVGTAATSTQLDLNITATSIVHA